MPAHPVFSTWRPLLAASLATFFPFPVFGAQSETQVEGVLTVVWGDAVPGSKEPGHVVLVLSEGKGGVRFYKYSEAVVRQLGGTVRLNSGTVRVEASESLSGHLFGVREVASRGDGGSLHPPGETLAVTGSRRWITLPCKFADVAAEPEAEAYFDAMYGGSYPGLDHYWRELSYGQMNVAGSHGIAWRGLPHPRSHYLPGGSLDLGSLFEDCIAAAEAEVDFSLYDGIQLAFNDVLDCCAWGGSWYTTLDGVTRSWRVAWLPPWGYQNINISAHEMGHGFGLPHSNNSDGDGNEYDNPWDVMSDGWSYAIDDAVFGVLGKHTIGFHKHLLGWFPPDKIFNLRGKDWATIWLDPQQRAFVDDYRFIRIPRRGDGGTLFIEARERQGYDSQLPGEAVIIHEASPNHPFMAWILDADDPPADNASTEGVMWRVGETFIDPAGIAVAVVQRTSDGFRLELSSDQHGSFYFNDFEDSTSGYSSDGLWHVTSACEAVRQGHSAPRALFFGIDEQCDYDTGEEFVGGTVSVHLRLDGLAPPYTLAFNYSLTVGEDIARVAVYESDTGRFEVLAETGSVIHPFIQTGGPWSRFEAILPLSSVASEVSVYFSVFADSAGNDLSGFWIDDVEIDGCFASDLLQLAATVETSVELYEACNTIEAGDGYEIAGSGDVTLRAGSRIKLDDGFVVRSGGRFVASIAPPIAD